MILLQTDKMTAHKDKHVGWITFNNPARHNAVSLEMWQGLADIANDFARDDDIRVVVVQGAGDKAFVAGADIGEFLNAPNNQGVELSKKGQALFLKIEQSKKIAQITI